MRRRRRGRSRSSRRPTPAPGFPPPTPAISSPQSYSWSKTRAVTFTGTAQAASTVELFDGSTSLGTTVTTAGGSWTRTVDLADGAHLVSARASNPSGTSSASPVRVIQVDTVAPAAPVITSPASGASVPSSFTLSGTVEGGTTVEVFENGASRGTVAGSDGNWSRDIYNAPSGSRSYTARATDLAGNVSAQSEYAGRCRRRMTVVARQRIAALPGSRRDG